MAPAIERTEHKHRYVSDRSESPVRVRHSPRRRSSPRRERSPAPSKSSPRRERSPAHRKSPPRRERSSAPRKSYLRREKSPAPWESSPRGRSPPRTSSSHKNRSPVKEKAVERARSPRNARTQLPETEESSRSPSPRTKRVKRAQAEREAEKLADRERGKNSVRDEQDKGRHEERHKDRDASNDRNSMPEKNKGGSSKSSRLDPSNSTEERQRQSRYSSHSPTRPSKAGAHDEVATKPQSAEHDQDVENDSVSKMRATEDALEAKEKQKPSFELSGKLAEETNRVRGVTLLFNEPPEARKPDIRWRLYVFKAGEVLNEPLYVHRQSCYLFGRERKVADIPTDHPSCSKQHAVLQYRLVEKEQPDGLMSKQVRPYLMDLGSTNGTFINDSRIEPQRYYEIFEKDTIKFGNSSREYVLLHEHSAG